MITLNRFAQRCLNIMRKRFKMNEHSSRKAFSIRIEVVWRKFDIASKYRSDIWGIERSGFFNGREKWAKGFENQRV